VVQAGKDQTDQRECCQPQKELRDRAETHRDRLHFQTFFTSL
jgi:hypothetical protein